jgi:transcriptional regulator with XRE-family HTH domain
MPTLRKLREAAGLTQDELAKLADVSQGHIAHLEAGESNPKLETMEKLARGLGVKLATIIAAIQAEER